MRHLILTALLVSTSTLVLGQNQQTSEHIDAIQQSKISKLEDEIAALKQRLNSLHAPGTTLSFLGPLTLTGMPADRYVATHFSSNGQATNFVSRAWETANRYCLDKGRSNGVHSFEMQESTSACGVTLFNGNWSSGCGSNFRVFKVIHCL